MGSLSIGVLFILGIGVVGGLGGAWLFRRLHVPQVVGYIAIGIIIGKSGLGIVSSSDIHALHPFTMFALGVIGFLVGGELKGENFRKYGKQFASMLVCEGVVAFVMVGLVSAAIIYVVSQSLVVAAAGGVVFGAVASATDPASTIQVLWEYRTRGMVTTALIALVAMDDALAMTLYGIGTSTSRILAQGESVSIAHEAATIGIELGGALLVGAIAGFVLNFIARYTQKDERIFALTFGIILLVDGIAVAVGMDLILASMATGVTFVNLAPQRSERLLKTMQGYSEPIYVLFFVMVGARLGVSDMPMWLWALVAGYVLCRSAGKAGGVLLGARLGGASGVVQRYTGLGMMAQGGVAVGLAIMASQHLQGVQISADMSLGNAIVYGVTATTLIVQLIGPPLTKLAVKFADEIDRDVTEEDIIAGWQVKDVMTTEIPPFRLDTPVEKIMAAFSDYNCFIVPVVDKAGKLRGTISLEDLKEVLVSREAWHWLLADDVAQSVDEKLYPSMPLNEAMDLMHRLELEQMPVLSQEDQDTPAGILDYRRAQRKAAHETVKRRQSPDEEISQSA